MPTRIQPAGNLLGAPRAEADPMLDRAFVATSDYYALTAKTDFNFVVGRRGTGKSALYRKTGEHFEAQDATILLQDTPPEHATMEFQRLLSRCETYRLMRATARITWRGNILIQITDILLSIWESRYIPANDFLLSFKEEHGRLFDIDRFNRQVEILKQYTDNLQSPHAAPDSLARGLKIEEFQRQVAMALKALDMQVVLLFDGLDEGWEPTIESTAALGGLAIALSDFADANTSIHGIVFVRDNMMRSLAHFDNDFSRHIEGNTLRLHWEERSLLHLVANRLRIALNLDIESDIRIWNRFAQRDLRDLAGFQRCLERTLYRPRDVLVLLNRAFVSAARQGRSEILLTDIDTASRDISAERLSDLLKEYDAVLPGLELFIEVFRDRPAVIRLRSLAGLLDEAIDRSRASVSSKARDFALLGSSKEIIGALHAVGFIGLRDSTEDRFVFCHDGSLASTEDWDNDREVIVHPCYWRALNLSDGMVPLEVATTVSDEYELVPVGEIKDLRTKGIGEVLGELTAVPHGRDGAQSFEKWVLRVVQILFQGSLTNFEAKPNPGAVSQRDIVATNMADRGFWQRVRQDYGSRQVIIEAKNYADLTNDDLRQVLSYSVGEYGRFAIIVFRSEDEGVSEKVRAWLRAVYHEHNNRLILLLPTVLLQRSLQKLRNARKHDYTEKLLNKRLDILVRRYVSIPSGRTVPVQVRDDMR
jgi:hypothetical protein